MVAPEREQPRKGRQRRRTSPIQTDSYDPNILPSTVCASCVEVIRIRAHTAARAPETSFRFPKSISTSH
jgi:hypothetical protein